MRIIRDNGLRMEPGLSLGEDMLFVYAYLNAASDGILIQNRPLYLYTQLSDGTLDSKYRPDLRKIYDYLDSRVLEYLHTWDVPSEEMPKYYNSVFYMQEKILRNTYRKENRLSSGDKRRLNNEILQSRKFQDAMCQCNCFIHPVYRIAYSSRNYLLVRIVDWLVSLKNRGKL